ncbi:MAG: hypothetical protein VYA47_05980 [Pseudomonadota bacterium]|nr:hypothetical protein [Pseudomonadota bacterium]
MSYEYIDRSSVTLDEFEDEDLRISMLKRQTGKAIDEATAKLLLTQAKLNKALTKLVPGSPECLNILRTLTDLYKNWEELNNLREEVYWNPQPWDEKYEAMEHLITLVQKVRGYG